jgi:hypothetical protein
LALLPVLVEFDGLVRERDIQRLLQGAREVLELDSAWALVGSHGVLQHDSHEGFVVRYLQGDP